tara:strand:- start:17571 stop:17813 length:243 start_codon:yes stop_codon:yes gene_type:complete
LSAEVVTAIGAIATAAVGGSFTVMAYKVRRNNDDAHESNKRVLDSIDRRTEQMDNKLDRHGEWIAAHGAWHRGRGDNPSE